MFWVVHPPSFPIFQVRGAGVKSQHAASASPTESGMVLEGGGQLEFGFLESLGLRPGVGIFWPSRALKSF